jgi:hypothetical protein
MKTLADLKRDLAMPGLKLNLVSVSGIPKNEARTVFKIQTNNICFLKPDGKSKSWLELPKASLLEYDGKTIKIFEPARRPLTDKEKEIMANEPRDAKQDEIDMLSDGSTMYYRRERYYRDSGYFYLFGTKADKGMRLTHEKATPLIEDETLKGELSIIYEMQGGN